MRTSCLIASLLFFCFWFLRCEGCLEEERNALLQLRDSFNYPNGFYLKDEWVGKNCCDWQMVTCDFNSSTYQVVEIYFYGYREDGQGKWYPNATLFTHFKGLRRLILDGNNIGGWIMPQALCGLKNLRFLDLSYNNLDDEGLPRCLAGELSFLEQLIISYNRRSISLSLLTALCGLRSLRVLDLSGSILSNDSIPTCLLHEKSSLETLKLTGCTLDGSPGVLKAICRARNIKKLYLGDNNLSDESLQICPLYNLSSLEILHLSFNNIKGSSDFLTGLCGLRNLRELYLNSNYLSNDSRPTCLLHEMSSLQTLDLSNSHLKGSPGVLAALCGARNLKWLDLSNSSLGDESLQLCPLYNLSSLESLNMSNNDIKGSSDFLTGLCNLKNLRELNLGDNMIEGSINPCWGEMNLLVALDLSHNQIVGNISSFFSNLTSLSFVDLSYNQLDGKFSFSTFGNLSKLILINLSNNFQLEVETESPTWMPSFKLKNLLLSNCNLNKHSRSSIPTFISFQYSLESVSLSYNSLQGTVPSWLLYNVTLERITLRGNQLSGQFPRSFENKTSTISFLDISDNQVHGKLPTNIDKLFPQLTYFNMSKNELQARIPPSFRNLMSLDTLDLSNNALTEVPYEFIQNNSFLSQLILSNNNLHDVPRFSNMTALTYLRLDSNFIIRPISISPSSFPSLEILDVSRNYMAGNFYNWFPILPNLDSLLLGTNHFVGHIPVSLCNMQQLSILDLSRNHLSGTIPSCLNNITSWKEETQSLTNIVEWDLGIGIFGLPQITFTTKKITYSYEGIPLHYMTGIDLSMNQIQGDIPSQMGDLIMLHSLNLSNNLLMGRFPESFQKLKRLESLDLSYNKLVGRIPPQIIQLNFLSTFSVAFNNLSGRIPFEENFHTFTESSYIGNSGLCGPPLKVNCSLFNNSSSQVPHNGHEKEKDAQSLIDSDLFFYSCVVICYMLGFWGFIAPLLLSMNWRRKYFGIMDQCFDWCSERILGLLFCIKNCR